MKVVIVAQEFSNNGGAEKAAAEHYRLLLERGDDVSLIGSYDKSLPNARGLLLQRSPIKSYSQLNNLGIIKKITIAARGIFDISLFLRVLAHLVKTKPDIVHLHKVKQLSPLVYLALKLSRVPTVATIHDHYLTCLNSTRIQGDGSFCDLSRCSFKTAFEKGCVGKSRLFTIYGMLEFFFRRKLIRDYQVVRSYLFPSNFLMDWTLRAGYPINGQVVPNFSSDAEFVIQQGGAYVLYFGRLSEEKGVLLLPKMAEALRGVQFHVVGDGPLRTELEKEVLARKLDNLQVMGARYGESLTAEISGAFAVLLPSICFENAPLSILEAFMHGKPVIASDIGGIPELVRPEQEGLLFPAGDWRSAVELISRLIEDRKLQENLSGRAHASYYARYSSTIYFNNIQRIYRDEGFVKEHSRL